MWIEDLLYTTRNHTKQITKPRNEETNQTGEKKCVCVIADARRRFGTRLDADRNDDLLRDDLLLDDGVKLKRARHVRVHRSYTRRRETYRIAR